MEEQAKKSYTALMTKFLKYTGAKEECFGNMKWSSFVLFMKAIGEEEFTTKSEIQNQIWDVVEVLPQNSKDMALKLVSEKLFY